MSFVDRMLPYFGSKDESHKKAVLLVLCEEFPTLTGSQYLAAAESLIAGAKPPGWMYTI